MSGNTETIRKGNRRFRMAIEVTTKVKYRSGMEYWEPGTADKLLVSKSDGDKVCVTFENAGGWVGSMKFPAGIAPVLARTLLIVADGHASGLEVDLP